MLSSEYQITMHYSFKNLFLRIWMFALPESYLLKKVIHMNKLKNDKLNRTISLRVTENHYRILTELNKSGNTNASMLLRKLIAAVMDVSIAKNNMKN